MRKAPKRLLRRPVGPRAPDSDPRGPGFDLEAASRVAELVAVIRVEGRPTPVVRPTGDRPEFDRDLCRAGIRRFARERTAGDWPEGTAAPPHVLVEELRPGVRTRKPLVVVLDDQMN